MAAKISWDYIKGTFEHSRASSHFPISPILAVIVFLRVISMLM